VLNAVNAAKTIGMQTVGMLGKNGGKVRNIVDHAIIVPSNTTARIQEAHILIGHCLCDIIEDGLKI
jgi:D-sedoheptulose 7-phosphate isomerase